MKDLPAPAELIASPYDAEARYSTKQTREWSGYKVPFTETGDEALPHLIVHVETTPAPTPDDHMVAAVHESLAPRSLLPAEHLVDKGYTDSAVLVASQRKYGVTLIGPVAEDPSWQARERNGFDNSQCVVDWDHHGVTCPAGKKSLSWLPNTYPKNGMAIEVRVSRKDCTPCPFRSRCTKAKVEPRLIGLQTREQYATLQAARQWQRTKDFQQPSAARAGGEGTHAQGIRRCGLRQSRSIGLAKTHLPHLFTAVALPSKRAARPLRLCRELPRE